MERTSKEFKFNDILDEIELYCDPCQYVGESWHDEQLDFEITHFERNKNNHIVFSIKVSSSECNVDNIAEQSIYVMCLKYFQWNSRAASTRTLVVSYNKDLTNFKGHKWHDVYSYELVSVSPLYGNKWFVIVRYEAEELLDTLAVAQAFDNVKDAGSGKTIARFKSLERVLEFIEAVNYVKAIRRTVCC